MPAPVASVVSNQKARVLSRKRKRPGKDATPEQVELWNEDQQRYSVLGHDNFMQKNSARLEENTLKGQLPLLFAVVSHHVACQ